MQVINTGSEVSGSVMGYSSSGGSDGGALQSLSDSFALHISKLANKALCASDAPYDAVVITHGVSWRRMRRKCYGWTS